MHVRLEASLRPDLTPPDDAGLGEVELTKKIQTCKLLHGPFLPSETRKKILSHAKSQDAGIRQGCPLSPFLFILVMTVLFRDIGVEHYRDLSECRLDQISFNVCL